MNRILAVAMLFGMMECSVTQPYVTNISPAGEQGILVEKCFFDFCYQIEYVHKPLMLVDRPYPCSQRI